MSRVLSASRYLIVIGVITSLLLAIALLIAGLVRAGVLIVTFMPAMLEAGATKSLAVGSIEIADILLIAVVLYIVATGLYELFIGDVDLPAWITITSLDDLKDKLLSIVVAVLDVAFLVQVVNWDGTRNLLPFGLAIASVVLALGVLNFLQKRSGERKQAKNSTSPDVSS